MRGVRGWRTAAPSANRGGTRGVLVFANLVPAFGREFVTSHWLRHSALGEVKSSGAPPGVRWANEVTLGDGTRVRLPSVRAAAAFEALLGALAAGDPAARSEMLAAAVRSALDETVIRERLSRMAALRFLPAACAMQAVWIFAAAPMLGSVFGFAMVGIPLIATALALDLVIAPLFFRAHQRLIPEDRVSRWTASFTMVFSPASAIAATRYLTRPLLGDMHPAAVIGTLCGSDALVRYARAHLWDHDPSDPAVAPVLAYIESKGITDAELRRVPERNDGSCCSYCPRCETQYVISEGTCNDCSVRLVAFPG